MAIRDSSSGRLTLAEINDYLMKKFPFFRGSYTGWRNSVRHNLSLNDCFLKVLRDPSRPWGKDNYWMLNPHSEYTFADGVFRRRRKRINRKIGREPEESVFAVGPQSISQSTPAMRTESAVKFTSSFAIDSILSKPFKRDSHNGFLPTLTWPPYSELMIPHSNTPASFPFVKSAYMDSRAAHVPHGYSDGLISQTVLRFQSWIWTLSPLWWSVFTNDGHRGTEQTLKTFFSSMLGLNWICGGMVLQFLIFIHLIMSQIYFLHIIVNVTELPIEFVVCLTNVFKNALWLWLCLLLQKCVHNEIKNLKHVNLYKHR